MKKNLPILIITIVLAAIAFVMIISQPKSTVKEELKDFAVSDTGAITKIFMADRRGNHVVLQRQPDKHWRVNNKFDARPDIMNTLMTTIKGLRVRTRVGKEEYNGVIKDMATSGVKCEIYTQDADKPVRVYYVGHETQDLLGTYMLLENSSTPFVMEIPGFNGYLNSRYFTDEQEWRDNSVFSYKPENIASITFNYIFDPEKSFKIERQGSVMKVSSPVTGRFIVQPDTLAIQSYLGFFNALNFEAFDKDLSKRQRDSLIAIGPLYTIDVKDKSGKINSVRIYPKPTTEQSLTKTDAEGKPLKYDLDRMYALINNGQDFVVIQQYVFGKLFKKLADFDATVKKTK